MDDSIGRGGVAVNNGRPSHDMNGPPIMQRRAYSSSSLEFCRGSYLHEARFIQLLMAARVRLPDGMSSRMRL